MAIKLAYIDYMMSPRARIFDCQFLPSFTFTGDDDNGFNRRSSRLDTKSMLSRRIT